MTKKALSELSRMALAAATTAPGDDTLVQAAELVRSQTGAVSALFLYGKEGKFAGLGAGDDADRYPEETLTYLQQRLMQLRVPLAFDLVDSEIRYITRATAKQRRDYMAWLVPTADSWTELLVLRGSWPADAITPLLEFVASATPALTIILERFMGVGRRRQLEQQLENIEGSVRALGRSAEIIGSVAAAYPAVRGLPDEQVSLLKTLAQDATAALAESKANRDLLESHLRLQVYTSRLEQAVQVEHQHATTDSLTGLLNHRAASQALEVEYEAAAAEGTPLSLLMGDIDGFKVFNDTYGHVTGDELLKQVAGLCRKAAEPAGTVFRYGGDEFLIILPNKGKRTATKLARQIVEQLGTAEFRTESDGSVPVRMSLGVASCPQDAPSPSKLVAIADAAMYAAKKRRGGGTAYPVGTMADTTFGVLDSLVQAVDGKDHYTKDHCDIVAEYAAKLSRRMNLSEDSTRALRTAGFLHDVGKLAIPDEILKKPAGLTGEEREVMQRHVKIGEVLIREVPQLKDVIQAVSCHHERYDGSGYPRGLEGEDIPLLGRIIAVADAYSAMSLDRPYRKAMPHDQVLSELVGGAGSQFDPEITNVFVELVLEERLRNQRPAA